MQGFFNTEWLLKNVMKFTDDEIEDIRKKGKK